MGFVLVIDDDPAIRKLIRHQLKAVGAPEVVEAADGREALDRLAEQDFNLLVVDWHMPNLSGLEVVKAVRSRGSPVPIVMVTAEAQKDRVVEALQAGATDYLVKPFDHTLLRRKLGEYLPKGPAPKSVGFAQVRDAMDASFATIQPEATVGEAIRCLLTSRASGLPVVDSQDNLVGMITEFQLTRVIDQPDVKNRPVGDLMTNKVIVANEETILPVVVTLMDKHQLALLPVVRKGKVVGSVSRRDLLRYFNSHWG
jgi:two-component system chemotaxis response regulator CheY